MTENKIHWSYDTAQNTWNAYNNKTEFLGWFELERVGRHMHWKWYQEQDIGMTGGCIDEMRAKQKELFKDRKKPSDTNDNERKGVVLFSL